MPRSIKKGPYCCPKLMKKVAVMNSADKKRPIKTWSRASMILPDFVGLTFLVHNGKEFATVFVSENMVGHKLGEFSLTRGFRKHGMAGAK